MATDLIRWTSHCDAVVNGVATAAQKLLLGRAQAWQMGQLTEFDAASTAEKLDMAVQGLRAKSIGVVKQFEAAQAANAAVADVDGKFG